MKKILFAFLFVFSLCGSLSAEETVYFGVKPPEGKIKFSDEFSFKMNVSYPDKYDALPDTSTAGNSYFDVLSFEKTGEVSSGTLKTSTWKISAQAFCLETSTFPALTWTLMDKGTPVSKAKSPEFKIKADPLFDPKKVKESDT